MRRIGFAIALVLTGCTTNQVGILPEKTTVNLSSFKLQLAVGTATLANDAAGMTTTIGLNTVETFRGANGESATTTNTPTLSGPGTNPFGNDLFKVAGGAGIRAITGISAAELQELARQAGLGIPTYAALLGTLPKGTSAAFGSGIGAFGYGFADDNIVDPVLSASAGCPSTDSVRFNTAPVPFSPVLGGLNGCTLSIPTSIGNDTQFVGGPPIWPSPQGYGTVVGFAGYPMGFTIVLPCLAAKAVGASQQCATYAPLTAGTYGLDVAVPIGPGPLNLKHYTASTTLPASSISSPLPAVQTPTVSVNGDGTASIDLTVPSDPRIFETLVVVRVTDCALSRGLPPIFTGLPSRWYSLITTQQGKQRLFLSNLGPPQNGQPSATFCTQQVLSQLPPGPAQGVTSPTFSVQAISFDYPAFEASYPASTSPAPQIRNSGSGTADLSMSSRSCWSYVPPAVGTSLTSGDLTAAACVF